MHRVAPLVAGLLLTLSACDVPANAGRSGTPAPVHAGSTVAARIPSPSRSPTPPPSPIERSRFAGRISSVPPALEREMRGTTLHPGCPVPISDLRLLRFNYRGFDGRVERGPMLVNAAVAKDVLGVFERLFDARFPIKRVALAREFHPKRFEEHRRISSHRSVTAGFNCRPVVTALGPGSSFSQHAYGLAIDINPVQNPYVTADGFVRNRVAERYLDRGRHLEGMIHADDVVVRSFAAIGWGWGGDWSGDKDYMHFSENGR